MPRKPAPSGEAPGAIQRDLVSMYARLTRSLENACGGDELARLLAELRRNEGNGGEESSPAIHAMARLFRRMGMMDQHDDADAFAIELAVNMGEAVSRPSEQVFFLLTLFSQGHEKTGLKPVCGATPCCHACQLTRECDHFNNPRTPEMALLTPAARLMEGNDAGVSDAELLGVILFGEKGTGQEPVVSVLTARYGRLRAAFGADAHEFAGIRHMNRVQALRLTAIAALHRRLLSERRGEVLRITSAQDIHDRYAAELRDCRTEAAVLLMLDQQNQVIRDVWFCEDSPTLARIGIADILRPAVQEFAPRVALIHNHPSNAPRPSDADIDFTRRLRSACDILGLGLVDHVIVTEAEYFSFAEQGMLR